MPQQTINQRLKFLIDTLAISARAFSDLIGESPGNTQNYIGTRQLAPKHEYLAKVLRHFSNVNAHWLLTGDGEPFLANAPVGVTQTGNFNQAGNRNSQTIKGNRSNVQANSGGDNTQTNVTLSDCKRDLEKAQLELEYLRSKVQDKEDLLKAKDDTIRLLRGSIDRPN